MSLIRLFTGIVPPKHIIDQLYHSVSVYKKEKWGPHVKWVKRDNLHLTLKFIGSVESTQTQQLINTTKEAVADIRAIPLTISGLLLFPKPSKPSTICAGFNTSPDLSRIADSIDSRLGELDIPHEKRPFKAHITLGRCRKSFPRFQRIDNRIASISFQVNEILFFQSILRPEGALYCIKKRIPLSL